MGKMIKHPFLSGGMMFIKVVEMIGAFFGFVYSGIIKKMTKAVEGKTILVTGGTGSFGKILVSKLLVLNPKEIIVFSRDEDKQGLMRLEYPDENRLRFVLGDIRDYHSVRQVMRGVDIVFHAAALKWITEVEYNVWEGVKTNVIGAQNIIEAAKMKI